MIRTVFLDFDNTLYSHNSKSIPQSAKNAITELKAKGISCVLATGRHILELRNFPEVFSIGLDGYVTTEGQICFDRNLNMICSSCLEGSALENLISIFNDKKYTTILVERDRIYANRYDPAKAEGLSYASSLEHPVGVYSGNEVYLGVIYVKPEEEHVIQDLLPLCNLLRWSEHGVDVTPKGRDKAKGILAYLDQCGLPTDNYIAIGDGENDISMITNAPIGIAMGNAADGVKRFADIVTTDIDADGIWNAVKGLGLI